MPFIATVPYFQWLGLQPYDRNASAMFIKPDYEPEHMKDIRFNVASNDLL